MCNLSQGYYENGFKKGYEQGYQEGKEEAFTEVVVLMIKNGKSVEEIAKNMSVTIEKVKKIESQLCASD